MFLKNKKNMIQNNHGERGTQDSLKKKNMISKMIFMLSLSKRKNRMLAVLRIDNPSNIVFFGEKSHERTGLSW